MLVNFKGAVADRIADQTLVLTPKIIAQVRKHISNTTKTKNTSWNLMEPPSHISHISHHYQHVFSRSSHEISLPAHDSHGKNPMELSRFFRQTTGRSPMAWAERIRPPPSCALPPRPELRGRNPSPTVVKNTANTVVYYVCLPSGNLLHSY